MRKIILVSALVLVTLGLASCSFDSIFKKNPESNTLAGLLIEQPLDDQYSGSHLLMDDSGNVVTTLRSLSINLSSSKYLNNKVQVIGKVNLDDDVFEVEGISVLEVIDPTNSNREFVEYKNTDLGFRIKYYSDWEVSEVGNQVTFSSPSENEATDLDKIAIVQSPFQYQLPEVTSEDSSVVSTDVIDSTVVVEEPVAEPVDMAKEALKAYAEENNYANPDSLMRRVGIDKVDALKVDGTGDDTDYFLYRSGFIYKFSFISSKTTPIAENKNIFNEMLAEFQFMGFTVDDNGDLTEGATISEDTIDSEVIDTDTAETEPVSIEGMTTFESSLYHFAAQYPKNWYYAGTRGTDGQVLHHYGFSDESLEEATNELISLDVMSSTQADNQSVNGSMFIAYVNVDGRTYRISGDKEYKDVISSMAKSIVPIKEETPQVN
jgi:hypothetical protein